MKRILLTLLLPTSMFALGPVHADPSSQLLQKIVKSARAQVVIPTDWDGIWTTQDSLYTCAGVFQFVPAAGADTLCGGTDFSAGSPDIAFNCTGTADATTFSMTCDGSSEAYPGCTASYHVVTHGTRTADTFFSVTTVDVTYSGTTCVGLSGCSQVNSHGTRIGPTAAADCTATPTKRSTWGEMKVIYR